jgi:Fe-S cluster biogenesis protein NfuA
MSDQIDDKEFRERTEKVERLVEQVHALEDPAARALSQELLQAVMQLHGAVLGRIVELISNRNDGPQLMRELARDPRISGMLLLYDLHPDDAATRVTKAVEKLTPSIAKQGGKLELVEVSRDEVRLIADLHGCSAASTKAAIEQAIFEAAPEISTVVIEPANTSAAGGFVPLQSVHPAA